MNLKGTQTEKNLETAFAGESQASIKYMYYSSQAKKDGYVQISNIFAETAGNEKEHAKLWYKLLHGGIASTDKNISMRLKAKTTNGPKCTLNLQKQQEKKALKRSLSCLTA